MKLLFIIFTLFFIPYAYAVPDRVMDVIPAAVDQHVIEAVDENARNSEITLKYNAHTHGDITGTTADLFIVTGNIGVTGSMEVTTSVQLHFLTASQFVKTDANKFLISSATVSAGHYYEKGEPLDPGDSVILINSKVYKSRLPKDPRCVGIYIYDQLARNSQTGQAQEVAYIIALGDSYEWDILPSVRQTVGFKIIDNGEKIGIGTLLTTSSTPGYLMVQNDIIHNYTVAKVLQEVKFIDGKAEGIYGYLMVN